VPDSLSPNQLTEEKRGLGSTKWRYQEVQEETKRTVMQEYHAGNSGGKGIGTWAGKVEKRLRVQ